MKRVSAFFILCLFIAYVLVGCARNTVQKPNRNVTPRTGKIAVVYDSTNILPAVPKADWFAQQLKAKGIPCVLLDMNSMASGEEDALSNLIQSDIGGLIVSLPFDPAAERLLAGAAKNGIKILQVGGNYYPSDISVSINYNQVGYMLGRELGGRLNKLKIVPKVLFLSLESGWKEIENGFIEGLREMSPDGSIVGRQVISADASIAFCDGETDLGHVNGVAAFYCDTDTSAVSYNMNAIQVRAITQNSYKVSDNLKAVLLTADDGTSQEALNQLLDLLDGKRMEISNLYYKPVFVYSDTE